MSHVTFWHLKSCRAHRLILDVQYIQVVRHSRFWYFVIGKNVTNVVNHFFRNFWIIVFQSISRWFRNRNSFSINWMKERVRSTNKGLLFSNLWLTKHSKQISKCLHPLNSYWRSSFIYAVCVVHEICVISRTLKYSTFLKRPGTSPLYSTFHIYAWYVENFFGKTSLFNNHILTSLFVSCIPFISILPLNLNPECDPKTSCVENKCHQAIAKLMLFLHRLVNINERRTKWKTWKMYDIFVEQYKNHTLL